MPDDQSPEIGHPEMFRQPTRREHRIAAGLFVGFAAAFVFLFVILSGWWFRWVFLVLAGYSFLDGVRHWREARHAPHGPIEIKPESPRRGADLIVWLLLFLAVGGLIVLALVWVTGSILIATLTAGGMIAAMLVMGWLASRSLHGRQ